MDHRRWEQIESQLQHALDLQPAERAAFLRQVCDGDEDLRDKLEALLSNESEAQAFMESPAWVADGPAVSPQSRISHYLIEAHIGAGGMGEVYKARDETLDRVVALKMLPVEFTSDLERVQRFRQEAFAASRLNHPNIITIFEIVQQDDSHFIAEEYVEGQTLRALLTDPATKAQRGLGLDKALDIAIQIVRALKAAHTAWIIHRDIKPENIMIREDGLVKVVDFGIAKLGDERDATANTVQSNDSSLTVPGLIMGTASYMSPEQARGEQLDGRTDLFSLGILLYEMSAGSRLFAGSTRVEAIERLQQSDDVVRQVLKFGNIPRELQPILKRVLQSNREERYASAGELLDELLRFKQRRESRTTRRIVTVSALAFVLAVAFVSVAAFLSVNETWEETILRDGHTAAVRRAVFSPDGKLLVSVGEDNRVIVWDFARRMRLKTITDHQGVVTTVSFSPDGKWFLTGDENGTIIVWNGNRLEQEAVWHDTRGPINGSAFSPDARVAVYGLGAVTVVRETGTWKKLHELQCGKFSFGDFLFPEDRQVMDIFGRVCDLDSGELLTREEQEDWGGNWVALSPDRKRLGSVDAYGYVKFVDVARRKLIYQRLAHHDHGRAVAYSPDGKLLATGAERVVLWDASTMTPIVPLEYESIVWSVAFSPDGRWLVSTHGDGSILIWDVLNRELKANLRQHSGAVRAVAVSPDGQRLATAGDDHSVILWNSEGQKEITWTDHTTRVGSVAFAADGSWIVSAAQSGVMVRHDVVHTSSQLLPNGPTGRHGYCVAISPDGRFVATTSGVYDTTTSTTAFRMPVEWTSIYSAAFSSDGKLLIAVTDKGEMLVVDTRNWQLIEKIIWSDSPLVSVSISPDGNHVVTGEDAKAVRLGTIKPLRVIGVIGQHSARVKAVAFSPDGKYIASAGDDKMVALWDVSRRKLVTTIGTHTSPIYALAFSPDGRQLLTGEHDRSVRRYTRRRTLWGFSLSN